MITINPNFAGFKTFFKNLLTIYQRETDTYKDINKEGLFERYMAIFGEHIDLELSSKIENYLDVIDASVSEEKFLTHLSDVLGNPPDIFNDVEQYRNLLTYIVSVYKVKGTTKGYKLFFYIFGFDVTIIETEPTSTSNLYDNGDFYDDGETYEPEGCIRCSNYSISIKQIIDNGFIIDSSTIALLRDAITFNEPINAVLTNFTIQMLIEDDLGSISLGDTQTSDIQANDLTLQTDEITNLSLADDVTTILDIISNAPTVTIEWDDTFNTVDKVCNTGGCTYYIGMDYADVDNDITVVRVEISENAGATWFTGVPNTLTTGSPTVHSFIIHPGMDNLYRIVVIDSFGNSTTSNILRAYSSYVPPATVTNFYYEGIYASDNLGAPGPGYVQYINELDELVSSEDLWIGECRLIVAKSIIYVQYAIVCNPLILSYYRSLNGNEPTGPDPEGYADSGFIQYWTNAAQTTFTTKEFIGTRYHMGIITPAPTLSFYHYGIISMTNVEDMGEII